MRRLVLWVALAGCDAPESSAPRQSEQAAPPEVEARREAVVEAEAPEAAPAAPPVQMPGGAVEAERRQAVFDVLMGGEAEALEEIAADPGDRFDPELVEAMAPTVPVTISTVVMRQAKVTGPLDKDIMRRIVRAHINEVRYCYNQGLVRDPRIRGTVVVDFVVLTTGKVGDSELVSSTVEDPEVGACIMKVLKRWVFPKPGGAEARVTFPFELESPKPLDLNPL